MMTMKAPGRSSDLHAASAEQRDGKTGDDGRDDTFLRCYAGGDTESDGQWQGHDSHNNARHDVGGQFALVILLQVEEQFGLEFKFVHI